MSRKYDSGALSIPLAVSSLWTTFNVLSKGLVLIFVFPFSLFLLSHSEVMILDIVRIFSPNDHFWAALLKSLMTYACMIPLCLFFQKLFSLFPFVASLINLSFIDLYLRQPSPRKFMQTKNYLLSHLPSFVKNGTGARIYSKFLRRTVNSHRCRFFQDPTASDLKNTKEKKASHRRQNIKNLITVV